MPPGYKPGIKQYHEACYFHHWVRTGEVKREWMGPASQTKFRPVRIKETRTFMCRECLATWEIITIRLKQGLAFWRWRRAQERRASRESLRKRLAERFVLNWYPEMDPQPRGLKARRSVPISLGSLGWHLRHPHASLGRGEHDEA